VRGADADAYFDNFAATGPATEWTISQVEAPFELGDRAVIMNNSIYNDEAGSTSRVLRRLSNRQLFAGIGFGIDVYDDAASR
jgi:hypothetical protein